MSKKSVVNIEGAVHKGLKSYCARHGLKMQFFVEGLITEAIKKTPKKNARK